MKDDMQNSISVENVISDPKPSAELVQLYKKLKKIEGKSLLFGQQDAYVEGTNFEANKPENLGKSDVLTATGKQPGIAGFDIGHYEVYYTAARDPEFAELIKGKDRKGIDYEVGENIDGIKWDFMIEAIKYAYEKGAVVTISWHSINPLNGHEYGKDNKTWRESVIKDVLPGGKLNKRFNLYLDSFIDFNGKLVDKSGNLIPYIFRPFHEHSGDWFWWGIDKAGNPNDGTAWSGNGGRLNNPEDYAALFRYTVEYLRNNGVHNLLYCISPDRSRLKYEGTNLAYNNALAAGYIEGYPGDDYIDIFGIDNYWDVAGNNRDADGNALDGKLQYNRFAGTLETVSVLAKEHGKMACLSEMGLANERMLTENSSSKDAPLTDWFLKAVKENSDTQRILYGLIWRPWYRGADAEPFGVYDRIMKEPGNPSAGFDLKFKYSIAPDLAKFEKDLLTYFVRP